jgi:hypothetical protein
VCVSLYTTAQRGSASPCSYQVLCSCERLHQHQSSNQIHGTTRHQIQQRCPGGLFWAATLYVYMRVGCFSGQLVGVSVCWHLLGQQVHADLLVPAGQHALATMNGGCDSAHMSA